MLRCDKVQTFRRCNLSIFQKVQKECLAVMTVILHDLCRQTAWFSSTTDFYCRWLNCCTFFEMPNKTEKLCRTWLRNQPESTCLQEIIYFGAYGAVKIKHMLRPFLINMYIQYIQYTDDGRRVQYKFRPNWISNMPPNLFLGRAKFNLNIRYEKIILCWSWVPVHWLFVPKQLTISNFI
jgi:hypothetical protein